MKNRILEALAAVASRPGALFSDDGTKRGRPAPGPQPDLLSQAGDFVSAHPLACLGLMLASGVALGCWMKRK